MVLTPHGPAPSLPSAVTRQAILRRVLEQNLGVAAAPALEPPAAPAEQARPAAGRLAPPGRRTGARVPAACLALCCAAAVLVAPAPNARRSPVAFATIPAPALAAVPPAAFATIPAPVLAAVPPAALAALPPDAAAVAPTERQAAQPVALLFDLRVRTIVIDPGHGGADPGALGADVDGQRLREKDLTLDLAVRLAAVLRAGGEFRVVLTRERDESVALVRRAEIANAADADLFVSIHANALADVRANAVETYYFGVPANAGTWRLAQRENAGSGLTIADFRQRIAALGADLKRQESLALARSVQAALVETVNQPAAPPSARDTGQPSDLYPQNPGASDAGIKVAPFAVLVGVNAPAVLAEVTCISNRSEAARLAEPDYRAQIAQALARGILAHVAARNRPSGGTDSSSISNDTGAATHEQAISEGASRGGGNG